MARKWYARVKADDNNKSKYIKIGIERKHDEDTGYFYYNLIAENGDDVSTGKEKTKESAIEAIEMSWGKWNTFEWLV